MRSRYSAFVVGSVAHLTRTWHPDTCPSDLSTDPTTLWTNLEIVDTAAGGPLDKHGEVEFKAAYRTPSGKPEVLHERSTFTRLRGSWMYVGPVESPT